MNAAIDSRIVLNLLDEESQALAQFVKRPRARIILCQSLGYTT